MPKMAKIQENVARGCVRMRDIRPHIALYTPRTLQCIPNQQSLAWGPPFNGKPTLLEPNPGEISTLCSRFCSISDRF